MRAVEAQDRAEREEASTLLIWCTRAFAQRGAEVIVRDGDANWIRERRAEEGGGFEVLVAGVPNLMHEFAHAAQRGELADDHGFDYNLIPLRLERAEDRRYLWEELASTVLSCAYLDAEGAALDAWFAEQIEIQGVFYGVEDDLEALRALLDQALRTYKDEAEGALERAYRACYRWLRDVGAPQRIAEARHHFTATELWRRYMRTPSSCRAS